MGASLCSVASFWLIRIMILCLVSMICNLVLSSMLSDENVRFFVNFIMPFKDATFESILNDETIIGCHAAEQYKLNPEAVQCAIR
mmetsp:Transcript_25498/g.43528  ORF Transcript_25498/g.43528 Transcript_25498/m.43528 type:complete len:85 (+) Transcript_25498:51-305(+)